MSGQPSLLVAIIGCVAFTAFGYAATLRVPQDHPSIQAGIDAANEGDVVLVGPSTYRERIEIAS